MKRVLLATFASLVFSSFAIADVVHLDDVIVDGSFCAGFDCVNGESFGFDTLRLKENNLRIHFNDTSTSAGFPSNDWRIIINDSSSGGSNYFAIEDSTAGRQPFRIEAGARSNALYVEADGDVGIGTSNPVVDLHVKNGNTPTFRLEQDGSSGFTPQSWDIAGNEANFFIRDVTNGSELPFRIKPGADSNSLFIDSNNDIGMGTDSPNAALHVRRTNGTAGVLIEETSPSNVFQTLLELSHNGLPLLVMRDTANDNAWQMFVNGFTSSWGLSDEGDSDTEFSIDGNGNATFSGDVTANGVMLTSDVNAKDNLTPVDGQMVLAKLSEMPISTWNFKGDDSQVQHMGPTAQDFRAAFGLGQDDRHISVLDAAGVALVGVKELQDAIKKKEAHITELEARIAVLESLIKTLLSKN